MRNFPRTARRRLVTASLAMALAVGTTTLPLSASADDLKDKLKQAENSVDAAHDDLEHSSARLQRAAGRLESAKAQLVTAEAALAAATSKVEVAAAEDARMQAELVTAEGELAQAEADLATGEASRDTQRDEMAAAIRDISMNGDPELLAFASILQAGSTEDLTMREEVRDVIVGRDQRAYNEYKAAAVLLGIREEQVADARDAVAAKRQEAADHLAYTEQVQAEKTEAQGAVEQLVLERGDAKKEAAKIRAKDAAQLRAEKKERDRLADLLRRRALAALKKNPGQAGPSDGVLSMPVQGGYVTSPFGYREHPIYHYWGLHDGTDFGGGCGLPLVASADGKVLQSYWSTVYGNRLVLDHGVLAGTGLASIYNHAARYTVSVGDQVKRGDVIGYVGDTGWSTACHLHFTVMANGKAVDPMNWL